MVEAARAAHAHSFIRRLPEGYDTVINENGGNLSQGQKQLLCIARVMLCLPPMLILDEATSNIDTRTEIRIQEAFARMMKGRTSFLVAHRLSTIREADVILVMKDGHILEKGTHESLWLNMDSMKSFITASLEDEKKRRPFGKYEGILSRRPLFCCYAEWRQDFRPALQSWRHPQKFPESHTRWDNLLHQWQED